MTTCNENSEYVIKQCECNCEFYIEETDEYFELCVCSHSHNGYNPSNYCNHDERFNKSNCKKSNCKYCNEK
jgi:hypothetical protein